MVWLYAQSGTLLFYKANGGPLLPFEKAVRSRNCPRIPPSFGLTAASAIAILIFCGAAGKSGQVPLHVWLPDAMEGPTPVSALIHAATMVAAGVFLMARVYPLLSALPAPQTLTPHHLDASSLTSMLTPALQVVTWIGAFTALYAATIAVAQWDIKRILAYSTVSQLGYMMMGLGVGGLAAVGMFHLITHAFFKALLFLGAGSVIHGCSGEQDIRRMGGLSKPMRVTFLAYMAGMLALCGFPLFAGFWSKDFILDAAHNWSISRAPFYMGAIGAFLTAFYMTRLVYYVFAGSNRLAASSHDDPQSLRAAHFEEPAHHVAHHPHESPAVMTIPLVILATFAVLLGFVGTPAWPWFQSFLEGHSAAINFAAFSDPGIIPVMASSILLVFLGLSLGWYFYGRQPIASAEAPDALGKLQPGIFSILGHAYYVDEIYGATLIRLNTWWSHICDWFDRFIWNGAVQIVSYLVLGVAWTDNFVDNYVVNTSFDGGCQTVSRGGQLLALLQGGRVQTYLRMIGVALIALVIFLLWGAKA